MRSGFKGVAGSVTGKSKPKTKTGAIVSTAITVALTQNGVRPDAVGTIAVEFYP